jgi:hypothetical protein
LYKLWWVGARVAHLTWALKCGAQWGLGNESVLHVDAYALLIHPAFSVIRIVGEVWGIFLSRQRRPVVTLVCPELIPASAKMTLAIWEGPRQTRKTYPRRLCHPLRRSCIGIGEGQIRFSSLNRTRVDTRVPWPRGEDSDARREATGGGEMPTGSGSVALRTGAGA